MGSHYILGSGLSFLQADVKSFFHFRVDILVWKLWPTQGLHYGDSPGEKIEAGRRESWLFPEVDILTADKIAGKRRVLWALESCIPPYVIKY